MSLIAGCVLATAACLLYDSPEAESIKGDHDDENKDGGAHVGCTVKEALCYPVMWLILLSGAFAALFWTGINLLSVSVFEERGLSPEVRGNYSRRGSVGG